MSATFFLEEVGRILREDSHGISGRLGGDEFIVFFGEIPDRQWAREKAALLCERLNVQYNLHGETLRVSASVGVVIADPNSTSFQKMFQQADAALYDAKFHGKAQYTRPNRRFLRYTICCWRMAVSPNTYGGALYAE